jgi:hypothetical protein
VETAAHGENSMVFYGLLDHTPQLVQTLGRNPVGLVRIIRRDFHVGNDALAGIIIRYGSGLFIFLLVIVTANIFGIFFVFTITGDFVTQIIINLIYTIAIFHYYNNKRLIDNIFNHFFNPTMVNKLQGGLPFSKQHFTSKARLILTMFAPGMVV